MFPGNVANPAIRSVACNTVPADEPQRAVSGPGAKIAQVSGSCASLELTHADVKDPFVRLKNGAKVPETMVNLTTLTLRQFLNKAGPVALYELNEKCKNPEHQMYGSTGIYAQEWKLMEGDRVPDMTRDIILSAIKGEGLVLSVTNPVAPAPQLE